MKTVRAFISAFAAVIALAGTLFIAACDAGRLSQQRYASPELQARVTPGLRRDEVIAILGEPKEIRKFPNLSGQTLVYRVRESDTAVFDVDLDAQGLVRAASLRDQPVPQN